MEEHPYKIHVQWYRPIEALMPSHWGTGTVKAQDGTAIHYTQTASDKPPVVLLHGAQVDGLMWLRTARALEADYHVVMPDFRGHGQSGGLEQGFASDILVADIQAVIETLHLNKPDVVGHSLGANIAGRLAAVTALRGVVLVDPGLQNFAAEIAAAYGDELPPWMQPILATIQALKTLPHRKRMVAGLSLLSPGTPLWEEADYVAFIDGQARFDPTLFRYTANLGYLFEEPELIAKIDCPILLLTVQPGMPGANIERGLAAFTENWRDGQRIHFDDSGHFIPFDRFDRFIQILSDFLKSH